MSLNDNEQDRSYLGLNLGPCLHSPKNHTYCTYIHMSSWNSKSWPRGEVRINFLLAHVNTLETDSSHFSTYTNARLTSTVSHHMHIDVDLASWPNGYLQSSQRLQTFQPIMKGDNPLNDGLPTYMVIHKACFHEYPFDDCSYDCHCLCDTPLPLFLFLFSFLFPIGMMPFKIGPWAPRDLWSIRLPAWLQSPCSGDVNTC